MGLHTHVFLNPATGEELVLPTYAEAGYKWRHGMGMETVTLDQLGDVAVPTVRTLCVEPLEVLLPARDYPFNVPGAGTNPWVYLERLERLCDAGKALRYIVTGTPVNAAVYISELEPSEPDGTGDLHLVIRLQEAKTPKTIPAPADLGLGLNVRDETGDGLMGSTYTVVKGDTMWAIARKFYGDGSLCWRLAAYNGIGNANILHVGQVLQIPPKDQLPATAKVTVYTPAGKQIDKTPGKGTMATMEEQYSKEAASAAVDKLTRAFQVGLTVRNPVITPTTINRQERAPYR